MAYAETTTVAFEKSISEIMKLLRAKKCDQIGQVESATNFAIGFTFGGRQIRISTALTLNDSRRSTEQQRRQRGRALLLVIKSKFESIETGIETFEEAFLPHVVMYDGRTVYERIREDIAIEYKAGKPTMMLLPDGRGDR